MEAEDDLLLLAADACGQGDSPQPPAAPADVLEEADLFLDLAAAVDAEGECGSAGGSATTGRLQSASGPRLSWAARTAAAGTAGAVPPGHQQRQAVLLPPGAIPRVAPPPAHVLPSQQTGAPGRGVALFGASQAPAGASGSGSSAFTDVGQGTLVERHAGLKIKNPRVSHTQLRGRLADTAVLRLSHVKQRYRTAGLEGSWATIAVVGERSKPRETATGRTYSIWKVTDLDQSSLSLFLFGAAHDDLWREPEGTIVALFTPKVRAEGDFSLSVDSADQIWVLGQSPEFGYCEAKKKNGEPCRMPVNAARCPFCPYHVQSEYNKMKPTARNEFQTSNLKTAFRPGMQRGLQWAPGEFESSTAKQQRIRHLGAAQLEGLAANARNRGSAAGARYLSTVANPAAAAAAEAAAQRKLTPAAAIAEAAQRGTTAAALAAAPIPAGRSGGALVLQLPRQGGQAAGQSQGRQKRKAEEAPAAVARRRSSSGAGPSGFGRGAGAGVELDMVELEEEEEWAVLVPGDGDSGSAAGGSRDPTADARARALALLRSAGGTGAGAATSAQQVPAALQADVRRMQQQKKAAARPAEQQQQQQERSGQQQPGGQQMPQQQGPPSGSNSRAALAQLQTNRSTPTLPSVVIGGASALQLPPAAKRPAASASQAAAVGSRRHSTVHKSTAAGAAGAGVATAAPKSAMEAAFGGVLEEAAAAAARGTRYKELVDDEEHAQLEKVMSALEQKDEAAAKMDSITKLTVQAFKCKLCAYLSERRRPECAAHPHAVERVQATKRWWQCEGCKYRFATVGQKYPSRTCVKCNQPGTHFTAVSMLRPRKEYEHEKQQSVLASREQLLSRGSEQKWCNSW
ncbi:hypothetical protein ABPG77_005212 [Micractinium sp. CCAP 211/92]